MAKDLTKKRKRDTHASGTEKQKKKKVSIQEPTKASKTNSTSGTIRVSKVIPLQHNSPVVFTAPGLELPKNLEFDAYVRTRDKHGKNPPPASAEVMLHCSSHPTMEYTAREYRGPGHDAVNNFVGIFDPKTNELQLVQVKKMEVRGTVKAREAGPEHMLPPVALKKTNMDMRNDLAQAFGTKKAKKALVSMKENDIGQRVRNTDGTYQRVELTDGDRGLLESMNAIVSTMPTREQLQEAVDNAKPVPKGNLKAEEIQDVYDPERIIGAETLASVPVRDWQQAIKANENIDTYSRFVANRIGHIGAREDSLRQLRLLRYLYWLILYWNAARPGRERGTMKQPPRDKMKEAMDGAPEFIIEQIRRQFTDNGVIRKFNADLIMTHCCVFACILDDFEMNTSDLREDLKLEPKKMAMYFSEIGAKIGQLKSDGKVMQMAKLSIPLRFPNSMKQRRR